MMKLRNTTYNALNIRGLKELPPPICKLFRNGITADNTTSLRKKNTTPALLHQASASCGRVLCVLFLTLFAFAFVACEKDASTDGSIHNQHPECEADEYYSPTIDNLSNALDNYGIVQIGGVVIKSEWGGETHITF